VKEKRMKVDLKFCDIKHVASSSSMWNGHNFFVHVHVHELIPTRFLQAKGKKLTTSGRRKVRLFGEKKISRKKDGI